MNPNPHFTTFPATKPFAQVLAAYILRRYGGDPLALSGVTVLLPSRRACTALKETFLSCARDTLLLPRIFALGDIGEEGLPADQSILPEITEGTLSLPPSIAPARRVLMLATLIDGSRFGIPAQEIAVRLAQSLCDLLDDFAREEKDPAALAGVVPEDFAAHWQQALAFLDIIMHQWPQALHAAGLCDPIVRRNAVLALLTGQWKNHPPASPVIAAGSTGSTPATARLLHAIACLPQGMVVLPGLDLAMQEAAWEMVDPQHPQFGMKELLASAKLRRDAVRMIDDADVAPACSPARVELFRAALLPADATPQWRDMHVDAAVGLQGVQLLECTTGRHEAQAIALALRHALETPGKTAALVTPDRRLARRVASLLAVYGIDIDDSAGIPLADTAPAVFLRLAAAMVMEEAAPLSLLALLKHPLCAAGLPPARMRRFARDLEQAVLRGVRPAPGLGSLRALVQAKEGMDPKKKTALLDMLTHLGALEAPFSVLMRCPVAKLHDLAAAHLRFAETLAASDSEPGNARLWHGHAGRDMASFMADLLQHADAAGDVDPQTYPGTFQALLAPHRFRPRYGQHPRLHILSPMESRMQQADLVILGSLNEGMWPAPAPPDPWLSRPMRATLGLPPPERDIGLSAHDFLMLSCAREVILSRAAKEEGRPAVPSRWLLRLQALLPCLRAPGIPRAPYAAWALARDTVARQEPVAPPGPTPPAEARPRTLPVTALETLMRDPYGFYAQRILKLRKLDDLDMEPGAADFGIMVHRAVELFVRESPQELPSQPLERLIACGRQAFATLIARPAVVAYWWPRFEATARWLIAVEEQRRPLLRAVAAEQQHRLELMTDAGLFTITARMDRVESARDETLTVIDYKTGGIPGKRDIAEGIACQLPIEAAMLQGQGHAGPVLMEYWRLAGGEKSEISAVPSPEETIGRALANAREVLVRFSRTAEPYRACPVPDYAPAYTDYAHLSRRAEWESASDMEEEDA